ncbi:MAG: hypothetical protein EPN17_05980 [Methylobacter sp.]|nr:MAG: hypothetical protein EPN17_05980 [Methylobacter sp.]
MPTLSLLAIYYLIISLFVGLCAIGRRSGFLVTFSLSIVLTPFLMLLILYITRSSVKKSKLTETQT